MKWTAELVFVFVGLVYGVGAWQQNKDYNYKLNGRTCVTSPESNDKWSGGAFRLLITIRPQSDNLLIGLVSQCEYAAVSDRTYNEITDADSIEKDFAYKEMQTMNKPFAIHLENGVIRKVSADPSLAHYEVDVLKIALSQFQVNTNAENLIPDETNRPPTEEGNTALYKVMEPTATGNCETLYDVKSAGESIEITKTRNNNNCVRKDDAPTGGEGKGKVEVDNTKVDEEVSSIIAGGSLKNCEIAASITSQTISANGIKSFYKNVNVTLESVGTLEQSTVKFEYAPDSLVDIGSLDLEDKLSDAVSPDVAMSDAAVTELLAAATNIEQKFTNCWGWGTTGPYACKKDLGPEFEYVNHQYKSCGWGYYAYLCKKSYPGCRASDCYSVFGYPPSTFCEKQFGENAVTKGECVFWDSCFSGFYRNRCCNI